MKIRRPMRGSARTADVEPDINITPLVDIVLVLLIIFMVVTPRMNQDIDVQLPGIYNPDPEVKGSMDPIRIHVPHAGEYWVEDSQYTLEGLTRYLKQRHQYEPGRRVLLGADAKLKYADVRPILAEVQEVGFSGLGFLVGQRHRKGEAETEAATLPPSAMTNGGGHAPPAGAMPGAVPEGAAPGEVGQGAAAGAGQVPQSTGQGG